MATQKLTFVTADGKSFDTEAEADAHEAGLQAAESIKSYVQHAGLKKAQATLVRNHIAGYLGFVKPPVLAA